MTFIMRNTSELQTTFKFEVGEFAPLDYKDNS